METEYDIKSALEYYILAGVSETIGETPMLLQSAPVIIPHSAVKISMPPKKENSVPLRQATTSLSQATSSARQNAHDLCEKANSLEELKKLVEQFDGCSLKLTAKQMVFGDGNPEAKIVLIGEAPGADEDRIGVPFVGRSGQLLDKMMKGINLTRDSYYITNILPWRPPGNRTPTDSEVAVCLPFLQRQLDLIQPDYLLLLGGSAANALFDNQDPISKLRGHWLDFKLSNGKIAKALATYHPAYLLRNAGQKANFWKDLLKLYQEVMG